MPAGIEVRHGRACRSRDGGVCNCTATYRAHIYDNATGKRIRRTFDTRTAAKLWRQDAIVALRAGTLAEAKPATTVRDVCEQWLRDARLGIVSARGGDTYKPATLTAYEQSLRLRVYPTLGNDAFYRVRRVHIQDLVDRLVAGGAAPATIHTTTGALGSVYGRALQRDELEVNPVAGVKVPAARNGRERFATPTEAQQLLAAVPERDRGVWATALYAGLRCGEIAALRWTDVDLKAGTISVTRSYHQVHGFGATKSRNRRRVPIIAELREHLAAARLRQGPRGRPLLRRTGRAPLHRRRYRTGPTSHGGP